MRLTASPIRPLPDLRARRRHASRVRVSLVVVMAVVGVGCVGGRSASSPLTSESGTSSTPSSAATRSLDSASGGAAVPSVATAPEADHAAVLALAGTFAVSYRHTESTTLSPGRALAEPYLAEARECVRVVDRGPGRVSLQHLLLIGDEPLVVKHWREDWEYAATQRLVFDGPVPGGGRWSMQAVTPTSGQWTRTVYAADDAPGYAAVGRWTHRGGVSEWEADAPAAAPAARHTLDGAARPGEVANWGRVQDEVVVVQHGTVVGGWTREETVVKLNAAGTPLAREHGVVRYVRRGAGDPPAVVKYWRRVGGFWAAVRTGWAQRLTAGTSHVVHDRLADGPRWRAIFALAEMYAEASPDTDTAPWAGELDATLDAAVDTDWTGAIGPIQPSD